jgi:hypothetical protein
LYTSWQVIYWFIEMCGITALSDWRTFAPLKIMSAMPHPIWGKLPTPAELRIPGWLTNYALLNDQLVVTPAAAGNVEREHCTKMQPAF